MKKSILVTGATGAQGGSVARHLLQQENIEVKCFTRDITSEKALALQEAGAILIAGDLSNKKALVDAMKDCTGAFGVTNFWEHYYDELQHGYNLIDAAEEAQLEHFVFSTLDSPEELSKEKFSVPHMETKAKMEKYCRSRNVPATFVHVAFYFENFLNYFPPTKDKSGQYSFGFPQGETPLAGIAIEDLGGIVSHIFENKEEFMNQRVGAVGEDMKSSEYAAQMSEVLGKTVIYQHIPQMIYASFGFPGAEELASMFAFNEAFIPNRKSDLKASKKIYPEMQSFKQWLNTNKEKFNPFFSN